MESNLAMTEPALSAIFGASGQIQRTAILAQDD
jgi:hypothetical protein